jgi:hypothetical protein
MKRILISLLVASLSAGMLGGLWAQSGASSVTASASGIAASGATVTSWTSGTPDWFPIEGTVGIIDADHADDDGNGGGLATFKVAASPASSYRVTIFLTDPGENISAYSYFNMGIKVVGAVTATSDETEDFATTSVSSGAFSVTLAKPHNTTDTTNMTVTLDVGGGNEAAVTSNCSLGSSQKTVSCTGLNPTTYPDGSYAVRVAYKVDSVSETGTSYTSAASVIDHDGDGNKDASDVSILNAEKGFISFIIDSVDGTLVDSSGNVVITGTADARTFNIGIHSGAFFTKDASDSDNLSPEFTIEVSQA